jgi:hypothetical protein
MWAGIAVPTALF